MTSSPNPKDIQKALSIYAANKQKILYALSRHIVALSWIDVLIEPIGDPTKIDSYLPMPNVATGFLLGVREKPFIVVAGHVLTRLEKRLVGREIKKARIIDSFEGSPMGRGDVADFYRT